MAEMPKNLSAVITEKSLNQLAHAVDVLRRAEDVRHSAAVESEKPNVGVIQSLDDLGAVEVYGVRDAKDSLSKILNSVSEGHVAFIEAGQGGAVVVMSTDALTEAVLSLEPSRDETLQGVLEGLPFKEELPQLTVRGRRPSRGGLMRLRAAAEEPPMATGEATVVEEGPAKMAEKPKMRRHFDST
jgi:hypothetical protein